MKFTHIINPYSPRSPAEGRIHRLTLESIDEAVRFAPFPVQRLAVADAGPVDPLPPQWEWASPVPRSVLDVATLTPKRPYSLIQDVIQAGAESAEGEFLIYSNMDIAVLPHFYSAIGAHLDQGIRSMVVNRRWLDSPPSSLPLLYSQIGQPHRGYDCFIFPRSLAPKLDLGALCLGIPWVGLGLFLNLRERGGPFHEFTDLHLTFHLGRDQPWAESTWGAYRRHNRKELEGIRKRLEQDALDSTHPWLDDTPAWRTRWRKAWNRWTHPSSS